MSEPPLEAHLNTTLITAQAYCKEEFALDSTENAERQPNRHRHAPEQYEPGRLATGPSDLLVTIFADRVGAWSYCVAVGADRFYAPGTFASSDNAKLAAFDRIADAAGW